MVGVAYLLAHLFFLLFVDLPWMPPPPPSNPDPASAKKKNPDGPLIFRDDFLSDTKSGGNKIVVFASSDGNFGGTIKGIEQSKLGKIKIPETFLKTFKKAAKSIQTQTNGFVLFSVINGAYLNLTLNWLCNVYALEKNPKEQIHNAVLIVSLDESACKKIVKDWKGVTCLWLKGADQRYNRDAEENLIIYKIIAHVRINLIAALAESKVPFVMFESDSVWLKNPTQRLFANSDLIDDADLMLPLNSRNEKGHRYGFNTVLAFTKNGTRRAAQEMRRIMNRNLDIPDQEVINRLCSSQYMGLVCREFPYDLLTDGKWFKMSEAERKATKSTPYIVNNNFYSGGRNKVARQTINGLWFLSAKGICNSSKARKIIAKYV
ncbi:nucleotide-diphospho-sugar transferase domain-containing protein [Ditylenchus destructor]|uniref:Nucleotide-diphospho-sugar transferase domain-containing protein n=1 Tax=Ditylenchus destructor TaxID=166010 RepID=A0AAD4MWN9_9BILA|nr:nucleotide-diphospho-sugar transferase domain-containing protein [Ditylenchus destructor]